MSSQLLEHPDASRQADRVLVPVAIALLSAVAIVPGESRYATVTTHGLLLGGMVFVLFFALSLRAWDGAHAALIAVLYLGAYCLPGAAGQWPTTLPIILAAYGAIVFTTPPLHRSTRFVTRGVIDRRTTTWMMAFTTVAVIALVIWRYAIGPEASRYRSIIPAGVAPWMAFAGIVPFAMLNAAFEEIIWRGILWQSVDGAYGRTTALAITSLSFGLAHFRGFPSGIVGMSLAAIYGLMMGIVRIRTAGLLGPWLAHVVADVAIYSMVVAIVFFA